MVDKNTGYKLTEQEQKLVKQHLGTFTHLDPFYKQTVHLTKAEAECRTSLVSEIEYDFQLALNKGSYYLGKAVINFYLHKQPEPGQLFLDFHCMAIADFCINDTHIQDNCFHKQRVCLEWPNVQLGWNTVQLRYLN